VDLIPSRVTEDMHVRLRQPYTSDELVKALNQMHPGKAPGPDGMNPFFYQKFWPVVGNDVTSMVLAILHGAKIPDGLNHTYVTLIPKKHKPTDVQDFCPISLCNVLYKLVTKVITNRLKEILPDIISQSQSAFTPGRFISDNAIVAFEVFHSMHCHSGINGSMAFKLDMAKAYDWVEWSFIQQVMLKLGFEEC